MNAAITPCTVKQIVNYCPVISSPHAIITNLALPYAAQYPYRRLGQSLSGELSTELEHNLGSVFELDILPNRDNDRNRRRGGKGKARQAKHAVAADG